MEIDGKTAGYLWDMLDSARAAVEFTSSTNLAGFMADRMCRNAVERNLEIIGEAARRVPQQVRESMPGIPWRSMIALRNVLTHEYDTVRYEILWRVCLERLPDLIGKLESLGINNSDSGTPPVSQ